MLCMLCNMWLPLVLLMAPAAIQSRLLPMHHATDTHAVKPAYVFEIQVLYAAYARHVLLTCSLLVLAQRLSREGPCYVHSCALGFGRRVCALSHLLGA